MPCFINYAEFCTLTSASPLEFSSDRLAGNVTVGFLPVLQLRLISDSPERLSQLLATVSAAEDDKPSSSSRCTCT